MTAKEIIHALGGQVALARALGIKSNAVSNWSRMGIPAKYWSRISRLAPAPITSDDIENHTKGTGNGESPR